MECFLTYLGLTATLLKLQTSWSSYKTILTHVYRVGIGRGLLHAFKNVIVIAFVGQILLLPIDKQ